jgi:class I lanthipeptide synthase
MTEQRCLYALLTADQEHHDALLSELVTPVTRRILGEPELDSIFFVRYSEPVWQLRFRILGEPEWIDRRVRPLLDTALPDLARRGLAERWEYASYDREVARYGGEEGMRLAEKVFFHDSVLCLDLLEAERMGLTSKSRRELSLLYADRLLDLMQFTREERLAFYAHGYRWALDMETWQEEEMRLLDARYQELKGGLYDLLIGSQREDPIVAWGGEAPARAAQQAFAALEETTGRLREAYAAGRISQEIVYLVWCYAHMQCNRMGISASGEAILRYFVHRLLLDHSPIPA